MISPLTTGMGYGYPEARRGLGTQEVGEGPKGDTWKCKCGRTNRGGLVYCQNTQCIGKNPGRVSPTKVSIGNRCLKCKKSIGYGDIYCDCKYK